MGEKKELPKKAKGEDRYAELLAYLEGLERDLRDPTPQNLEAIRAAAVEIARSRPSKKEETTKTRTNRTQKKGGNEGTRTHLSKQETLRKILDVIIVDPDAFDYAMNELRGLFFAELLVKYDDLLADRFNNGMNERRSTSHRPSDVTQYREPEFISERMSTLLAHLCRLADVFARSFSSSRTSHASLASFWTLELQLASPPGLSRDHWTMSLNEHGNNTNSDCCSTSSA